MSLIQILEYLKDLSDYAPIISFLWAIIGWEETLVVLWILVSQGVFNIWNVFIFYYIGIIVSDILWYAIGKSQAFDWFINKKFWKKIYNSGHKIISAISKKNDFQALLITKFIYWLRIPTLMYLSKQWLQIKHFLIYTFITNFIWSVIILLIGILAWKWLFLATSISDNLILFLFLIGLILILFNFLMKYLSFIVKKCLNKDNTH